MSGKHRQALTNAIRGRREALDAIAATRDAEAVVLQDVAENGPARLDKALIDSANADRLGEALERSKNTRQQIRGEL